MAHFVVTATGADQPGIIAAVTGGLVEQGCSIEDSEMAVLRGHFAMMLGVAGPSSLGEVELEEALAKGAAGLDMVVTAREVEDTRVGGQPGRGGASGAAPASLWSVSVRGADRPGIVFEVTRVLARHGVNVVGMESRVLGEGQSLELTMSLEVSVPPEVGGDAVVRDLDSLAGALGAICSMRPR